MDKTSETIENFETILKKQSTRKPIVLYSGSKCENSGSSVPKHSFTAHDILSNISRQLRALQSADCVKTDRPRNMYNYKKPSFVPVNLLQSEEVPQKSNINKFDTQCVSDTQLINIIQEAEAFDTHKGVIQEFENSFGPTHDVENQTCIANTEKYIDSIVIDDVENEKQNYYNEARKGNKQLVSEFPIIDISLKESDPNKTINILDTSVIRYEINKNEVEQYIATQMEKTLEIEENINKINIYEDIDLPLSPVFDIKTNDKKSTVSHLVFDLEIFENFEKLAVPIIEEISDIETARHLINSQIIGKELCLQTYTEPIPNEIDGKISPIYTEYNDNVKIQDSIEVFTPKNQEELERKSTESQISIDKFIFKDEILFSSDEEEYMQRNAQDLPLTCVLETSFYEQSDILDKTMYVGFQTASNKSIQICTNSFFRANSLYNSMAVNDNEPTFTELVEKCEAKDLSENIVNAHELATAKGFNSNKQTVDSMKSESKEIDLFKSKEKENCSNLIEFTTVSGQGVDVSKDIFIKSKALFQDVDNVLSNLPNETDLILRNPSEIISKTNLETFNTADNKKIKVSGIVLAEPRNIIEETIKLGTKHLDTCNKNAIEIIKSKITENIAKGFIYLVEQDNIILNNEKEHTEPNIDDDILKEFEGVEMSQESIHTNKDEIKGFETASNKNIIISDSAVPKTKNMLQDMDLLEEPSKIELESKSFVTTEDNILSNHDNLNRSSTSIPVIGFKAANNKEIKVFTDSVLKFKKRFQDAEKDDFVVPFLRPDLPFEGFKTTINENIDISVDSLARRREIFPDIESDNPKLIFEDLAPNIKDFAGFQTECNKKVTISKESLQKSKKIFADIDISEPFDVNPVNFATNTDNENVGPVFKGFQIVGKKPKVSAQALAKRYIVLQDIDKEIFINENPDSIDVISKFKGFRTASNKPVKISDEALTKSRKIFQDIDQETSTSGNVLSIISSSKLLGFQTDRNKEGKIIEEAVAKSRKMFDEFDNVHDNEETASSFKGFQTASNKQVKISEEALAKSRKMFDEFDNIHDNKETASSFKGFQTASNKQVKISEEALAKSRKMFDEFDNIHDNKETASSFKGFQTASNKQVKISEEALAKSRKMFYEFNNVHDNKETASSFKGFQTASNKQVKMSEEALAKSRKMFDEFDNIHDNKETASSFKGFQTASNKQVKISEEALAKSRKMFDEFDNIHDNKETASSFKGFQTASNKPVKISEEALAKSRKMFDEFDNIHDNKETASSFKGFQTASNKQVKISEEALAKSRKMFDEFDNVHDNKETAFNFKGFQTASNKQVKISEESLAKSRKMFGEFDNVNDNKETASSFKGFQTASNKQVKISEEALAKSRKMFDEFDNVHDNKETASSFKGFQTASNKEVKISQETLAKSRHLFQDLEIENSNDVDNIDNLRREKTKTTYAAFKTANNSNIKVSEEALRKSNEIFAEIDNKQANISVEANFNKPEAKLEVKSGLKDVNLENIINTQVLSNFEQTLYTEDFCKETPKRSKRSGSPILSCPRAKKRKKFEIPYSQHQINDIKHNTSDEIQDCGKTTEEIYVFDKNYKMNKKYQLKDLKALEKESNDTEHIDRTILNFNFDNLLNFEFQGKRNDITDSPFTTDYLKIYFQQSVNKKLIPDGWVHNHLKLIIWKLISYEVKFPKTMSYTCTARNVIEQLKYRYDKELYNAARPALRKIMEKDDTSSRTLVLCVVATFENGVEVSSIANMTNNVELLLTDGWYCIMASTDKMLTKLIADGKIVVGSKIVTNGAELVNCEQGVAPWEDTSSIRLKLSGNSTRRARWDARLGYQANAAILCPLSAVRAEGGRVSKLRVVAARVYPALYVERFDDGSTVTRSERLEHLHQMRHETERQAVLEKIYEEVEKEFSDQDSQDSDGVVVESSKRRCLDSGSQIAKVMKTSKDPLEFRSHLTDTQKSLLQEHTTRKREKLLQNVQRRVLEKMENEGLNVRRNVIRLLKVRVAGVEESGGEAKVTRAMMSIWKPTDAVLEMISEGSWMEVMNVMPTAVRYSEIQISAGRQSVFSQSKYKESEKLKPYTDSLKRTCYPIKDLTRSPSMTTDYNEMDTVGLIFLIEPSIKDFDPNKNQFQNVYLTDENKNIICLNFWGGLKKFGFENVLDTGQIVACTNLQKRAGNTRKNIPQYRVTEFSSFTKTPKSDRARQMAEELSMKLSTIERRRFCEDCAFLKNNHSAVKLQSNTENITPYRFQNIDVNATKNRIYIDSPFPHKKIDDNLNLSGLDFESTFKQTDTQLSPKALVRKKQVNEKIAKLKMYGEPPPLSPIQILNRSKNAGKAYKSPLVSNSDISSVGSERKILLNEQEKNSESHILCSPVIMNRTFIKRTNVNPVKLNFDNGAINGRNGSDVIDHFAEDFDASPPLSLD